MSDVMDKSLAALVRDSVCDTASTATSIFTRVQKLISDFEKNLPEDKKVGISVPALNGISVSLDSVSFWNPDLIIFHGHLSDGSPVELIQHTAQLTLVLLFIPLEDNTARRRIGYNLDGRPHT